jgi:hypothetical protein
MGEGRVREKGRRNGQFDVEWRVFGYSYIGLETRMLTYKQTIVCLY